MTLLQAARLGKLPYYIALLGLGSLMARWQGYAIRPEAWFEMLGWLILLFEAQVFLNDGVDARREAPGAVTWARLGLPRRLLMLLGLFGTAAVTGAVALFHPEWIPWVGQIALLGLLYHFPPFPLKRVWPVGLLLLAGIGVGVILAGYAVSGTHPPPKVRQTALEIGICLFLVFGNKDRKDGEGLWAFLSDPAARRLQAVLTFLAFLLPTLFWGGGVTYALVGCGLGVLGVALTLQPTYRESLFWLLFFAYALPTLPVLQRHLGG